MRETGSSLQNSKHHRKTQILARPRVHIECDSGITKRAKGSAKDIRPSEKHKEDLLFVQYG